MAKVNYDGNWIIPNSPNIGFIIGDGIGVDVTPAAIKVIDAAVSKAFAGSKKIDWTEVLAGEKSMQDNGELLPQSSLDKIKDLRISLKGPLMTPIGKGFRSLNVTIRQKLDLHSCVRPVRYFKGLPSPMKNPEDVDIVIFRENTEDVYSGIEFESGSADAREMIDWLELKGKFVDKESGLGVKPISPAATHRIVKSAIDYAIEKGRKSLTLVHKGNIMKFTEGAFDIWSREFLKANYSDTVHFEEDGECPDDKILIKSRIADAMFQFLLLKPTDYDVIATMNLNGDYLSDAAAAQVGGLGIAPGANIGDGVAVFEATHGTAPKHAGKDTANPGSVILSGVMMLDLMGWQEAGQLIVDSMEKAFRDKTVTQDLSRQIDGATTLSCSGFAEKLIENINS